jgi:class 3 adenylate cyclase
VTTGDGVRIAYQTVGQGPLDLVWIFGFIGNLDVIWEQPRLAAFLRGLASFGRLTLHDRRGAGLSDRVALADLGTRVSDLSAVLDAAGCDRAVLVGASEGGALAALFAATHPDRTEALVMFDGMARMAWAADYPWGESSDDFEVELARAESDWGTDAYVARYLAEDSPSVAGDATYVGWFARLLRNFVSPSAAGEIMRIWFDTDLRHVLPAVRVPTLVIGRSGWPRQGGALESEHVASLIPGARHVVVPGSDSMAWVGNAEAVLDAIGQFAGAERATEDTSRVLLTLLFTDIVASTAHAAEVGDQRWEDLLVEYRRMVREVLDRFRGTQVSDLGDGTFAIFDGPGRAIRCAQALTESVRPLGIQIRAGIHTGECERHADGVDGISVHIGARVSSLAGPGEVLVSTTVKDLVAGSGLQFVDRGTHKLRGVPGRWRVFACSVAG